MSFIPFKRYSKVHLQSRGSLGSKRSNLGLMDTKFNNAHFGITKHRAKARNWIFKQPNIPGLREELAVQIRTQITSNLHSNIYLCKVALVCWQHATPC